VTLPINPEGLTQAGTSAVATLLTNGVDLDGVNVMTMDYGQSLRSGTGMEAAAESALAAAHKQLAELYRGAGQPLDDAAVWRKLGATPMVGQNDIQNEVFSLADAKSLNQFGRSHNLGRMSMWSANRDVACSGGGGVNTKATSSCSGVNQNKSEFAEKLGEDFYGHY